MTTVSKKKKTSENNSVANVITADYVKHIIECKCVHPMFKHIEPTVFHKFVVFSEMDPNTFGIKHSYAQCNNCAMIHKVIDIGVSAILKKEESSLVPSLDELKYNFPNHLKPILEKYDSPIHVWQETQFIYENKLWGRFVILSKEKDSISDTVFRGKYLILLGEALFKIDSFEQEDGYIDI